MHYITTFIRQMQINTVIMMKIKLAIIMLLTAATLFAGEIKRDTYVFGIEGSDTLRVDTYRATGLECYSSLRPVVVFAFGGGFRTGSRSESDYIGFFHYLANQGIIVVSTDYRTGLKNLDPAAIKTPGDFTAALQNAIGMAVTDFYGATAFVLEKCGEWGGDPGKIIACGSSAGAITALQAEYMICNGSPLAARLPEGFNYAGVISFAGAICSEEPMAWKSNPCPMMLFQGDADRMVPYGKVLVDGKGLFGSRAIADCLKAAGSPYWFYTISGAGHEMAGTPMTDKLEEILFFISRFVIGGDKSCTETVVPGKTGYKTDFTIEDYIRANMPQ